VGVVVALAAAYGSLATMMARFLFPARPPRKGWMYVAVEKSLGIGESLLFETPRGATVNIARQQPGAMAESFIALSSTCPHLGCQVHWEPQNDRFFCPCHNGVFSPDGTGIGGPPGDAGQSLSSYPLKVEGGLLFIEVDQEEIALGPGRVVEPFAGPSGPGHDPCLRPTTTPCGCTERS
jgi:nitrite reductase/ring-hydroxylating ferredoxin subunit